ncbi:MAG: MFS transporter [Gordonia sp. (in: high G+C Gram-positive bacteria)]|uniref:MFS transporter n=1 Tax=Gordonia sp. (in: high G+C Gram-positive bacteria) TaxID=84139 RepID=UPI003BB70356
MNTPAQTGVKQPWWRFSPPLNDHGLAANPKQGIPVLLFLFVFALVMDNGFKLMTDTISRSLDISLNTASLQATIPGIIIGVGAVVYAALADSFPIRRLMIIAVILMSIGSVVGVVLQGSFGGVLTGRIIQTAGLAAAETLYVIWATKHFSGDEQKRYLGFSTAAFQASMLFGALGAGFIAGIGWQIFFLINLIALLAIPFIIKYVPAEEVGHGKLDIVGLFLIAVFAATLVMFMQDFNWWYLLPAVAGMVLFVRHVKRSPNALITPAFFADKRYSLILVVVFLTYLVQLGYQVLFPALVQDVYGGNLAHSSWLMAPGYVVAILVGVFTGNIAKFLPSKPAIIIAIVLVAVGLIIGALAVGGWKGWYVISMMCFGSGFALMYAPLLSTAVRDVPSEKTGIAIGFYNLVINMAVPIGIAVGTRLQAANLGLTGFIGQSTEASPCAGDGCTAAASQTSFGSALLILAVIAILALVLYLVFIRILEAADARAGHVPPADAPAVH